MSAQAETHAKRRARRTLTLEEKTEILEKQNFRCPCGRVITVQARTLREWRKILGHFPDKTVPSQAKFDHKVALSEGGSNDLSNFQGLCGICHAKKHDLYRRWKK